MPESSVDTFRYALSVARKHGFYEIEIETPDGSFEAKLEPISLPAMPSVLTAHNEDSADPGLAHIVSSLVGYYQATDPPLAVGQTVAAGDVVAIIAALGLANDVEAGVSGEVADVLVETGQPVEYGQVLATVRASL